MAFRDTRHLQRSYRSGRPVPAGIAYDDECPVARHFPKDLLGEENHGDDLPLPAYARTHPNGPAFLISTQG